MEVGLRLLAPVIAVLGSSPGTAATFEDAVRSNLALGLQICIGKMPDVASIRAHCAGRSRLHLFAGGLQPRSRFAHWYYTRQRKPHR